jgi:hypothetical protein
VIGCGIGPAAAQDVGLIRMESVEMSRHAFGEILENEVALRTCCFGVADVEGASGPRDLKGHGLDEWIDSAVVGWDEPLQTYFLQCLEEDEGDEPVWWFGTAYAELPAFADLCGVIRLVFGGAVEFEFVDRIERGDRHTGCSRGSFQEDLSRKPVRGFESYRARFTKMVKRP